MFPFQEVKKSLCHVFIQCRGYIWIRSLKKNRIRNPALKYQIKPNGIPVWFLSTNIAAYFRTTHSLVVELLSWKAHRQLNKKTYPYCRYQLRELLDSFDVSFRFVLKRICRHTTDGVAVFPATLIYSYEDILPNLQYCNKQINMKHIIFYE